MLPLIQRLFTGKQGAASVETPFVLMGLNALVFLDPAQWAEDTRQILGADRLDVAPEPDPYSPAIAAARLGQFLVLAFEGTHNWRGWAAYFANAGASPWGPAPGVVFAPFARAAAAVEGTLGKWIQKGDRLLFTGHSLGAAIAGMWNSLYSAAQYDTQICWAFACPRFGDASYHANASGDTITLNLPGDPVPYLPPDVWQLLQRAPDEIRWRQAWGRFQAQVLADPWERVRDAPANLDWLCQLASANLSAQMSPHQTYQYIRSTWTNASKEGNDDTTALATQLQGLGLFDPWPMSWFPSEQAAAAEPWTWGAPRRLRPGGA